VFLKVFGGIFKDPGGSQKRGKKVKKPLCRTKKGQKKGVFWGSQKQQKTAKKCFSLFSPKMPILA
jgi:hypothetical protein